MKVPGLSAPRSLYLTEDIPGTHFCQGLSRSQGHSVAGRIKSIKSFKDPIGNRTRDLLACSAVPQPTALPDIPENECELQ
jgi:hypothetical protein